MKNLNFKADEDFAKMLKHDAHQHDMNVSEYIRYLVDREHSQMTGKECKL